MPAKPRHSASIVASVLCSSPSPISKRSAGMPGSRSSGTPAWVTIAARLAERGSTPASSWRAPWPTSTSYGVPRDRHVDGDHAARSSQDRVDDVGDGAVVDEHDGVGHLAVQRGALGEHPSAAWRPDRRRAAADGRRCAPARPASPGRRTARPPSTASRAARCGCAPTSTTPPAAAITTGCCSVSASSSASVSRARNAASPSVAKISRTVRPVRASITRSLSSTCRPRRSPRTRLTVVLPTPIIPTSTRCWFGGITARRGTRRRCARTRSASRRRTCAAPRRRARGRPSSRPPRPSPARR